MLCVCTWQNEENTMRKRGWGLRLTPNAFLVLPREHDPFHNSTLITTCRSEAAQHELFAPGPGIAPGLLVMFSTASHDEMGCSVLRSVCSQK